MSDTSPSPTEAEDARAVDRAIGLIQSRRHREAVELLREVAARSPAEYRRIEERGEELLIRFWDQAEFLAYVAYHRGRPSERSVSWILSAYPRAWFYLGFAYAELREPVRARQALDRGLELEPDHPRLLCEKGQLLATLRDFAAALELYQRAERARPETGPLQLAVALRGQGFQLIELARLDDAERVLRRSLELDPDSELAVGELRYIQHLRGGGSAAPAAQTVTVPGEGTLCSVCGRPVQEGKVRTLGGRPQFVCPACEAQIN